MSRLLQHLQEGHALRGQLAGDLGGREAALGRLAAGHGDGVVIQDLVGDICLRRHSLTDRQRAGMIPRTLAEVLEDVLAECFRVAKPGAVGYLWCGDDFVSYINRIVEKVGFQFRKVIHWHKTNPFPAIYTRKMYANSMEMMVHFSKGTPKTWNHKPVNEMHNFIQAPICMGKERTAHKTQKPLKVCLPFIEISSNEGDLVLDPFMGSGSTAVAARKLKRNFIGFELIEI